MATAAGSSAESEALKLSFSYLVNSIDTASVLRAALSSQLVSDSQRSECVSETDSYNKAEKFLGHLQRAVNGDSSKFHEFVQVLKETKQVAIALVLQGRIIHVVYLQYPRRVMENRYFHDFCVFYLQMSLRGAERLNWRCNRQPQAKLKV